MSEFLDYLYKLRNRGSDYGLDRIHSLVCALGNPQNSYPVIHVAGTNGKGSVCAMLASMYQANGYKVGLFTSPHLIELGERIQINGEIMPMTDIERFIRCIQPIAADMESKKAGMHPTFFEVMTAVAFSRFKEECVDLVILETGLGGRLDSTNVVIPAISIITSISLDHCDLLGSTLEEIAEEKAGIIKAGIPVITGWLPPVAISRIASIAAKKNAPLHELNIEANQCPKTNLQGSFQRRNAALAVHAVNILNPLFPVEKKDCQEGLLHVNLPGRWQVVPGNPTVVLDACHNQGGVRSLLENLKTLEKPLIVWVAAFGSDRAKEVMEAVSPLADQVVFFTSSEPRACSFQEMLAVTSPLFHSKMSHGNWNDLQAEFKKIGLHNKKDLVVTGSIYLVGHVLAFLQNMSGGNNSELQDIL